MTIRRLKYLLLIFFIALALPTSILVYQAYGQLQWEAFHQHQQLARELSLRIDARFKELIEREESRPFSEYSFLNVSGNQQSAFLQRSPLSQYPLEANIPGLLGYFQVDTVGQLQTPTVPLSNATDYGIDADELRERVAQEENLRGILRQNKLVKKQSEKQKMDSATISEETVYEQEADSQGLSVFDSLSNLSKLRSRESEAPKSSGRVADLKLDDRYDVGAQVKEKRETESKQRRVSKPSRIETTILPESLPLESPSSEQAAPSDVASLLSKQQVERIRTFESEVDSFEFSLLDSGHFVLYRRVWNGGERYVQGLLFDQNNFIDDLVTSAFQESALASVSDLILAHQGNVVQFFGKSYSSNYRNTKPAGAELLYQTRLVAPFGDLELIYSLVALPIGAGNQIILWSAFILALVLIAGTFMLYRLGARQISLAQQQQDFVSAVSHELKTPLTSIRMYGEMLREGWADETRKKSYYDFIFFESERLSRLINNVLQLARMSRRNQKAELVEINVGTIVEDLSPRLTSQLDQAGFSLKMECDAACRESVIRVDSDWFTQVIINLVDNAVKFSANVDKKQIDINCQLRKRYIVFSVRDYGPGIAKDQMKKIFKLFYRSENELTRETVGTGIGLALVHQLVTGMEGEVDVVNCEPGVEFQICFDVVG